MIGRLATLYKRLGKKGRRCAFVTRASRGQSFRRCREAMFDETGRARQLASRTERRLGDVK